MQNQQGNEEMINIEQNLEIDKLKEKPVNHKDTHEILFVLL